MKLRLPRLIALTVAASITAIAALPLPALAGPNAWVVRPPAPGTRVVYISSSQGNDGNSGLGPEAPRKTIAAGWKLLRPNHPDRLLLKRGDTWSEGFGQFTKSGKSAQARMVIGSYGDPNLPRPKLRTRRTTIQGVVPPGGVRAHVVISSLDIAPVGYTGTGHHPAGIDLQGTWHDLVIEDCLVQGYANNIMIQGNPGRRATDIQVRRNVIVDSFVVGESPHSQGLMIGHTDGALVEGNVLDHNGWNESVPGAVPTIFRHNVYINPDNTTEITVRGNIVARGAASGLRCAGTICEGNLLLSNPLSIIGSGSITRRIAGNVVIDSRDIGNITQIGKGITGTFFDCEIVDNILAHRTNPGTWNVAAIDIASGSNNVLCEGNTVFDWAPKGPQNWVDSASAIMCKGASGNVVVRDNEFQMPRGGRLLWCEEGQYVPGLSGNVWWSRSGAPFLLPSTGGTTYRGYASASGEQGGQYARPEFKNPHRTPGTFARAFGWGSTLEDYLREVRKMERGRFEGQERFAPAAIRFITDGFSG